MALVVFLRGVNVGGHRTFRPSVLAGQLAEHDVVNIGAAGTFVVRTPGARAELRARLLRHLPFETQVVVCEGRDVLRIATHNPFSAEPPAPGVVRFVSILSRPGHPTPPLPLALPSSGEWLVRLEARDGRFVFGTYRRHMKTIRYLGAIDRLFGDTATTRNWNTISAVAKVLSGSPARRAR
jgi:uncharacterized protein (DUF1697 family)